MITRCAARHPVMHGVGGAWLSMTGKADSEKLALAACQELTSEVTNIMGSILAGKRKTNAIPHSQLITCFTAISFWEEKRRLICRETPSCTINHNLHFSQPEKTDLRAVILPLYRGSLRP